MIEVQVIFAVIIIVITGLAFTVDRFVSGLHILQVGLPCSHIRCVLGTLYIAVKIVRIIEPLVIEATGNLTC